jgi:hypothetical protein
MTAPNTWLAAVATADITPVNPLWLAGYGGRDHGAEGTLHPIWIKVLALQDAAGNRGLVISSDLCGFSAQACADVCEGLRRSLGLERASIMLTSSHNHCAPVQRGSLVDYYPLDEKGWAEVDAHSRWLEAEIVAAAARAFARLEPASLWVGLGETGFAVNRRNNRETEVPALIAAGRALKGPVDHSVPVLAVRRTDQSLMAVLFGYACHTTTLSFYQWCGDYAGFAQIALESALPGSTALFHTGCGGDQNPLPRRSVELCERYGTMLAQAVQNVLGQPMQAVSPELRCAYATAWLDFERVVGEAELRSVEPSSALKHRWATRLLARLQRGEEFEKGVAYPVSAWRLGSSQLWIGLGAEAVVDYSLRFKREYGSDTWVTGYAHEMVSYIPSRRVWEEGGYEGGYLYEYGHPAERWAGNVEERVGLAVEAVVGSVRGPG